MCLFHSRWSQSNGHGAFGMVKSVLTYNAYTWWPGRDKKQFPSHFLSPKPGYLTSLNRGWKFSAIFFTSSSPNLFCNLSFWNRSLTMSLVVALPWNFPHYWLTVVHLGKAFQEPFLTYFHKWVSFVMPRLTLAHFEFLGPFLLTQTFLECWHLAGKKLFGA